MVDLADVEHEGGDRAGRERARHREVAADQVDDRGPDRGDEAERDEQHAAVHRGADADVAHAARPARELVLVDAGPAEQLRDERAGDVEALGREVVHLRVQLHAFTRDRLQLRPEPARRKDEQRAGSSSVSSVSFHSSANMIDERHRDPDDVRDDGAERARHRLLRADDVAVEPGLQRAGLRAGEERDRHVLHVVEQRDAQVADQAFADPGGEPTLHEREQRVGEREADRGEREPGDERAVLVGHGGVEEAAEQQGRDRRGDRRADRPSATKPIRNARYGRQNPSTRRSTSAVDALRLSSSARRKPIIVR